jgi:hypothetical protein
MHLGNTVDAESIFLIVVARTLIRARATHPSFTVSCVRALSFSGPHLLQVRLDNVIVNSLRLV